MSALTDPIGAGLDQLVEAQRGMTEWEADWFLRTGQLPDLSQPPVHDPLLITSIPPITEAQARAFLGGEQLTAAGGWGSPSEITLKFDPNQDRDSHGRWVDEDLSDGPDPDRAQDFINSLRKRIPPKSPEAVLNSAPVGISGSYRGPKLECRPETLSPCTDEQRAKKLLAALLDYRGLGFKDVNGLLRKGETQSFDPPVVEGWIDRIDDAMTVSRLPHDVLVMRGLWSGKGIFGNALEFEDDLTGFEWVEKAYVSTTVNPETADEFGEKVIMHVRVPAGTGALKLSEMSTEESYDEAEMLLERGLKMRVVRERARDEDRRILDVEVVPA